MKSIPGAARRNRPNDGDGSFALAADGVVGSVTGLGCTAGVRATGVGVAFCTAVGGYVGKGAYSIVKFDIDYSL